MKQIFKNYNNSIKTLSKSIRKLIKRPSVKSVIKKIEINAFAQIANNDIKNNNYPIEQ